MDGISVEEVFVTAGINVRSHCLAACQASDHFVFASDGQAVVQTFPSNTCGRIVSVSDRFHSGPITILKRVTNVVNNSEDDVFLSAGVDGRVVLYSVAAVNPIIRHLTTLDGVKGSIGALCGTFAADRLVLMASWVSGTDGGVRIWWLNQDSQEYSMRTLFDVNDIGTAFVIASDMQTMSNGRVLLAVGTTRRMIELYCETSCEKAMKRVLSVAGHEDWIHSIAFNQSFPVLMASAGQDGFVKLWRIEEEEVKGGGDGEICVTKNRFQIESPEKTLSLSLSVEAVLAGHDDWVHSTQWNSEGCSLLTSSSDKTVIVWKEACDGRLWTDAVRIGIVGGQAAGFFGAIFSPSTRQIVAYSYHGGLYGWVFSEKDNMWNAVAMCSGHTGEVRDVAWHPDGKFFISVGEDKTTRIYIPQKDQKFVEVARPQVHGHSMQCLAVVSSSTFVSGAEEKIFRVFEAPQTFAKSLCNISGFQMTEVFGKSTFPHFGAKVSALGLSNKAIEDSQEAQPTNDTETHWEEAAFEAVPSELHAPPTEDCLQQNTLWPEVQKLYGHGYEVYAVAANPSGSVIATTCKASQIEDAVIVLWDTSDWSKKFELFGHKLTVTQLEWSPDGTRLLSVSRDRTAVLYREQNGDVDGFQYEKVWSSGKEHSRIIWSCCWFNDSKHFVTASRDMQVISWKCSDALTAPVCRYKCSQPVTSVAVCCDMDERNAVIAAGLQDGSLVFLHAVDEGLQLIRTILVPKTPVDRAILRLRVNPMNHCQLAVAGSDGKLRLLMLNVTVKQ